jgi:hypothetical protein
MILSILKNGETPQVAVVVAAVEAVVQAEVVVQAEALTPHRTAPTV